MNKNPTIFVIDDDDDVRQSLRWLFESVKLRVEDFSSAGDFLAHVEVDRPGCVILDVRMPEMDGLELLQALQARLIGLPVIMISGHGDVPMAVRAMQMGAIDFLQKPVNHQHLLERTRFALAEDRRFREEFGDPLEMSARFELLTPKERTVLDKMVHGHANKVIARDLGVSIRTIETHRANLLRKLGVQSVADLVRLTIPLRQQR
ncbi:DNA-binding response regulator [Thiocapsa imhoffii]|uniref:DNA-binding response regulator n=1 Tax=Thiocapsa imhoffii TaxID=382777 RepID=A0A9X0WKF2_9GAMM|nr:response regulator [Thiocapsa imhoffii]MBK1646136.1 DNA-binding response regulator [Thiocapsa imhoffii]